MDASCFIQIVTLSPEAFLGDQYMETVIPNSGFTISHWLSDFFQGYQETLKKLISVHFSF